MKMVLGLLLTTATSMIINTVDNVVDAKHLDCPPFPINFCCATKKIPVFADNATTHFVAFKDMHGIIQKTDTFIAGVSDCIQSANSTKVSNSGTHRNVEAVSNSDSVTTGRSITGQWVPPPFGKQYI
jgi:hypothetical protein